MVPQSLLCPAEIAEIAEIGGPSQMAGFYVGRLKARNYSKFDSKLFNGPAESFMSRRNRRNSGNFEPSQMAVDMGRFAQNSCVPMVASDQRSSDTKI